MARKTCLNLAYKPNVHNTLNTSRVQPRTIPIAQTEPAARANGFSSRNCMPELPFFPVPPLPDPVTDPVPVAAVPAVVVVVEKVGDTNAVAALSQLKHTVSNVYAVPAKVVAAPVDNVVTSGTINAAPAVTPMSTTTDGTMCVRFGKICERNPLTELDEVRGSQSALTPLRDEMATETVGRSRNMPACMSPEPERSSMLRRTSARRPRERVMVTPSDDAAKGMAVIVDLELCSIVNK
jgi:hypothetical protein